MKKLAFLFLSAAIILSGCSQQKLTPREKELKKLKEQADNIDKIRTPDFIFYATTVTPEYGIPLNIEFPSSLRVTQKMLDVELPYLGHFYTKPIILSQEIPIKLYSTRYVYTVNFDEKTDEYDIAIVPQDVQRLVNDNIIFRMKLKKDGSGTLSVKTDNRDEISYKGYYR